MISLLVVGSINHDVVTFVPELPRPGETVLATSTLSSLGGKGCNQAVAAARMGVPVHFVGAVGSDATGDFAVSELESNGVDVSAIARIPDAATGAAYITVDASGENAIVVASGANARVSVAAASASLLELIDRMSGDVVVLAQGELSAEVTDAVARVARERGVPFVLNLAPVSHRKTETIQSSAPLIVNETEGADLLGEDGEPSVVAAGLRDMYGVAVVLTIGARGAVIADESGVWRQPAPRPSSVVDTTGAGDAFVGVIAASLCEGLTLRAAARRAVVAASFSVAKAGTTSSYPTADQLELLMDAAPEPVEA
jgi:ribokinase